MPKKSQTPPPKTVERMFLRPREAAEALGVSVSKMYELIRAGIVPAVRLGRSLRIPVEALRELAKATRRESP